MNGPRVRIMRLQLVLGLIALNAVWAQAQLGVRRLADLNPGAAGSYPSNLIVFGDSVLFVASTSRTGAELWRYKSGEVALAADINDTTVETGGVLVGNSSTPRALTVFDGAVYFTAWEPRHGGELWSYDGVRATRVTDIAPDANDNVKPNPNSSWPNELTAFGSALYFSANDSSTRTNYELWRYDGSIPSLVADLHPNLGTNHGSYPSNLAEFGSTLLFAADDGAHGFELWQHAGAATTLAGDLNPGSSASSSFPKFFRRAAGLLFFQAFSEQSGYELWEWNGAIATNIDINPASASSYAEGFTEFKGSLYFRADDGNHGFELWRHDGASAALAADIHPSGSSFPKGFTPFGEVLVFAADDGVHGWELWKWDGSAASMIRDLNPQGDSFPEFMTVHKGGVYFSAFTPETGYELWVFDGQQIALAGDINEGAGSSYPRHFVSFADELVMAAASDGNTDWELWALSPSGVASAPRITDISNQGGEWVLKFESAPGARIALQATADFQTWEELGTVTVVADGTGVLTDSMPATNRFYRLAVKP